MEEMVVCWAEVKSSVVEVRDKNHWIMNVVNEEGKVYNSRQVDFGGKLLVRYCAVRERLCSAGRMDPAEVASGDPPDSTSIDHSANDA